MAPTNKSKKEKQHPWETPTFKGQNKKNPQIKRGIGTALYNTYNNQRIQ